jgi:hypothetical protein
MSKLERTRKKGAMASFEILSLHLFRETEKKRTISIIIAIAWFKICTQDLLAPNSKTVDSNIYSITE